MFGPRTYSPSSHRFFNEVATLMVNLASLGTAVEAFAGQGRTSVPMTPNYPFELRGRLANASFQVHSLMHGVVANAWPAQVEVFLTPPAPPTGPANAIQLQGNAIANVVIQLVGSAFLRYFEENKARPRAAYPNGPKTWPDLWRFAWVLRNAIAHSDQWAIDDPNFPPTTWHGFTVGPADSGQPWFHVTQSLGGGDLLLLLEELDASPI